MKIPVIERQPKVLVLSTPLHFLHKLAWEIDNFLGAERQSDVLGAHLIASYHAANCAITAWHMTDWVWEYLGEVERKELVTKLSFVNAKLETFQDYVRTKSRPLHLCYELATGAKHRNPQNKKMEAGVKARDEWRIDSSTTDLDEGNSFSQYNFQLLVEDGEKNVPLGDLFQSAFSFWETFLRDTGLIEDRFVTADG